MSGMLLSLPTRENNKEIVFNILIALRALSDSSGCRHEMIHRGTIDILNNLLSYCDEKERLLIIKVLHNLFKSPQSINKLLLETSIIIVIQIIQRSESILIFQYCAASINVFTIEKTKEMKSLTVQLVDSLVLLLQMTDPLIQYFVVATIGDLFYNHLWYYYYYYITLLY